MYGRADDDAVCLLEFFCDLVHAVVYGAFTRALAGKAARAAADIFRADLYKLRLNSLCFELSLCLAERGEGRSRLVRASVYQ